MAALKAPAGPPSLPSGPVSLEPPSLDREPDESERALKDDSPAGNDELEQEEEEEERTSGVSELDEDDSTTTALDATAESAGAAPASTEEGSSEVVDVKMDYENIRIVSHVKSRRSSGGDDSDEDKPRMSRFKGVCWYRQRRKWQASIYLSGGKKKHLGYFESELDAAKAYDRAAALIHGEDSAVYNFDPTTGKLNPTAKRRLPGSSADRAYTPRVRLPQAVQVRPPPPPLPAGLLAVTGLPVPLLPPTPPLRSAPSTASPLGGGVLRHTLLTTDQPLPPPSLHRLLDSTGASDPSASAESTSGQVARSRRPNAGQKRLRDDEVEAFEDDEDEDMEDEEGGRSRQRRRHQQLQPEQDDDDEEWTPSMSRRRRASASTPVSLRDDTRLSSPPLPVPPAAPPAAPPAPPLQLAFPPLQETSVTLPAPDPTTPQLILVAGLLLEMIVTTRDQGFKARLKKLLKAVAKGCTAVRVIVGAAADRWDLKEDVARWADVLELLLESLEDGTFD